MNISIPDNHQQCTVCQQDFFADTPLRFEVINEREIRAQIVPTDKVEGYDHIMQGGLVTALHDSAMLHCLFHVGVPNAKTVSLNSRFHSPVYIGQMVEVRAQWIKTKRSLHFLQCQITQQGTLCSSASSQFMS
ncbi:hypothetical protein BCU83_18250 [Vibrio breoganii]|uniref:PaaI family thioesterase n=1 Tax=Vibrio breoganii TaxID=553239 RepID=UPI000C8247F2|nr:PaaI family thioesterase [Vibrio breoganii]PMG85574.1 hypothetical protein BCU83_18250 [Vibrio breoganii]